MKELLMTKIDVYKLNVRMETPFEIALGILDKTENLLIRITASNGVYGVGEGAPLAFITGEMQATAFEAAQTMARLLIGKDPLAIEVRLAELDRFLTNNTATKSCFDMALYDLLAKQAGLPLYALLGGKRRVLETDETIGINTPEIMAQEALGIKNRGFPAIKIKLGTNRLDDLGRIQAIREAIGPDLPIRIDANQGWDPVSARLILQDLAPYGIQYAEEPLPHWNNEALRRVRQTSPIPIMADETIFDHHDAFRLASMGACDYFNIKLAKCGGIHNALKINAVAEAAGI
ncbi:MAG: dipeptide epimerase, partial [Anaerolineales bacterium]|nr:dipeptide epimerase [Anaerolineales bacterium]